MLCRLSVRPEEKKKTKEEEENVKTKEPEQGDRKDMGS